MKNLTLLLLTVFVVSFLSSCGGHPLKTRKGCKGKGSWNGNRNLGYTVPFPEEKQDNKTYYVHQTKEQQS